MSPHLLFMTTACSLLGRWRRIIPQMQLFRVLGGLFFSLIFFCTASLGYTSPTPKESSDKTAKEAYVVAAIHLREPTVKELEYKFLADQAYSQGDLQETLRQLRRAFQVRKNPRYLANQGLVLVDFGRYREAVTLLQQFIDSNPPFPKLRAAQAEITLLKPDVHISSEPPGARVTFTGSQESLGHTPFTVNLLAGEHRVTLEKEGYDPLRVSLFITPGKPVNASYVLNSQINLAGPPPPGSSKLGASTIQHSRPQKLSQLSSSQGLLSVISASTALIAMGSYFFTREAIINRDASLNRADWSRAQGEAHAYYELTLLSAGLSSLSGIGALSWWLFEGRP